MLEERPSEGSNADVEDVSFETGIVTDESVRPLIAALRKLFLETSPEADISISSVINPSSLLRSVCSKAPQFRGFLQHDSHEFLRCLLNGLNNEELSEKKHNNSSQDDWKSTNTDRTFVDAIFGGKLSSTNSLSNKIVNSTCLAADNLAKIMLQLFISVRLDWFIGFMSTGLVAGSWEDVGPGILLLHGKPPWAYNDTASITVKNLMEWKKYLPRVDNASVVLLEVCTERGEYEYRLIGLVEHLETMRGGHYVAYVRGGAKGENGDCVWYHASDAYVHVVSLEEVLRCEAYTLFYDQT
ncbi:unnamed protein product [Fraxinus pennsylvanica]|uniref:USP domain-containing protein n=1 Tax=Fraxinus pennsylvanica TaxID=56036 RepID=A0AAD1ZGZ1_9LAMI|nr:unnamed protein product [Fraxinus pennsylvanica]